MALLVFQHDPLDPPARLGAVLRDYGHQLRVIKLHEGQSLPPDLDDVTGIVSLGGAMNVDQADQYDWMAGEMELIRQAHEQGLPVVGICLGAQLIAKALGGEVAKMQTPEIGWRQVRLAFPGTIDPVFAGTPWNTMQFHMHGQEVTKLPPEGTPLAGSQACKTQAFKVGLSTYAYQYHFEWTKKEIETILSARAENIAKANGDVEQIRSQIDDHYDMFRHLGDRMCHNIANLLFTLSKRLPGRRGNQWHVRH